MKKRRIMSYGHLSDADLLAKGGTVLNALSTHPVYQVALPTFVPTLAILKDAIDKYQEAFNAAVNRDRMKIALRKAARAEFIVILDKIARYMEMAVGDDTNLLLNTGFDITREYASANAYSTLSSPSNFSVTQGDHRGSMTAKASRIQGAASYEAHVAEGDPTVEANWNFLAVYVRPGEMLITDREPGKLYSFRLRAIGVSGVGPWSTPVSLIAT